MAPPNTRDAPFKLSVTMMVAVVLVQQAASATGLLVFLNVSLAQVRSLELAEELKCLSLLNTMETDQEVPDAMATEQDGPDALVQKLGEPCVRLAQGITAYITKVTERIISKHTFKEPRVQPRLKAEGAGNHKPSAHLTLRDNGLQGPVSPAPQGDLHQSCRHPVHSWGNQSFTAHLHNMTLSNGRICVPRPGRYFLYAQMYFRYATPGQERASPHHRHQHHHRASVSHQLVACVYKKTSYARPIQLLKGVATRGWSPDSDHALLSVYQGGLFHLRGGDEIFVSVSTATAVHVEDSSSYFGAFRFDP